MGYLKTLIIAGIILLFLLQIYYFAEHKNFRAQYLPNWEIVNYTRSQLLPIVFAGKWVKRTNVSLARKIYIDNANMGIRKKMGLWQTSLAREDGQCGLRFVMNGGLQAQCNDTSENPCCNEQIGRCGNNETYCDCRPYCTDYKNIIQPEFSDWVEKYEPIRNFDMNSTCTYLEEKFSSVTFIGDSLVRQFFGALLIHLTNDLEYGALKFPLKDTEKAECAYEEQFFEQLCRLRLARNMAEIKSNPKFCQNTKSSVLFHFEQTYGVDDLPLAVNAVKQTMTFPANDKVSLFVIGIGGHNDFEPEVVWNQYLLPLIKLIYSYRTTYRPFIVWSSGNPNGPIKPVQYALRQGSPRVLQFNNALKTRLKTFNVTIFENFDLVFGVYSFDGSHYGQALNLVKVRLLVKLLRFLL